MNVKYLFLLLVLTGCADQDRICVQTAMAKRKNEVYDYVPLTYEQARETCGLKKAP